MSNQLKKKFLGSDSVDGSKIKFSNDDAFRARNALDTADISLFKLNTSNEFQLLVLPRYNNSNVATESYVDSEVGIVADDVSHLVTLSGVAVDSDSLGSFTGSTILDNRDIKEALQDLESAHEEVDQNVNDLVTLSGVAENAQNLGAFSGSTISDDRKVKEALQDLESAHEAHLNDTEDAHDASAISISAIPNLAATNVQGALAEIQGQLDTVSGDFVDVAGDTMTGSLVVDSGAGSSNTISDQDIVISDGQNQTQIAISEITVSGTDLTSVSETVVVNAGSVSLVRADLVGGTTFDANVALSATLTNQLSIDVINHADQNHGTTSLSQSSLDFSYQDTATGVNSTTSFQHNYISILVEDTGAGSSDSFSVDPGVGVSFLSNDGTGPAPVTPTQDFHLVPKKYVDDGFIRVDGSNNMMANLDMMDGLTHYKIVGLGDPTAPRDAVNKQYVDAIAEGLHVHAPAKVIIIDPLSGSVTYDNGTNGVGATLTLGTALTSVDDYTLQDQDRIIINGQANQAHNGIYIYQTGGTELLRASDFDTTTEAAGGDFIFVQEGTVYGNSGWVMSETTSSIGTSPIIFVQFSGAGQLLEGDAIDLQGNEINVRYDNVGIKINGSNELELKDGGVVASKIGPQAVTAAKINPDVAGLGLVQDPDGSLKINTDNSTLEIPTGEDFVRIKASGVGEVQIADNAVTTSKLFADSVTKEKIALDVAGLGLVQDPDGSLKVNPDNSTIEIPIGEDFIRVKASGIGEVQLADGAVTTSKLFDDSVTKEKIASDVAGLGLVQDPDGSLKVNPDNSTIEIPIGEDFIRVKASGIGEVQIADNAVTTSKVFDDAITKEKIASDVAGLGLVQDPDGSLKVNPDGSTLEIPIGEDFIRVKAAGIGEVEIANNAVTTSKIAADAVDKSKIALDVAGEGIQQDPDGSLAVKLDGTSLSKSVDGVKLNIEGHKQSYLIELGDTVLASNYYDLDSVIEPNSLVAFVDRVGIHEGAGEDYIVNLTGGVGGKTRITFVNALVTTGQQKLAAGDKLYFTYQRKIS